MFTLNVPENGVYPFFPPGAALAMVDSFGFIIAPPPPGEYVITGTDESAGYTVTVNVMVEAPQVIEPTETTEASPASEAPEDIESPSTT